MTREEFELLVKRLEQQSAADPVGYRRRLGALALLGYGYVAGVVVLLLGGALSIVWLATFSTAALLLLKKVGWALLFLIYVVLRAMWVKLDPPAGRRLERAEFPELFRVIEEIRSKAKAPRLHDVLLTDEFNAAVVQQPRFGVFGGTRNYLILGLPFMQALAPEEFAAVIAHEFGHLSGAHGRFGAWIYRLRAGWGRLLEALEREGHWGSVLFTRFLTWYAPLFNAYSFVQARQQEYQADRVSVQTVGAAPAASALLRANVQGDFIGESFWPAVFKRAEKDPVPTVSPFAMLGLALKQSPLPAAERWLGKSLSRQTDYDDTHPCLADRLEAMGVAPHVPQPLTANAADTYLGRAAKVLQKEMDEQWRAGVKQWWGERHQYVSEARARLAALESKAASEPLTEDELWDRARFTEELASGDVAMALYAALLESNAQHVGALWRHGGMLLDRDDPRGIEQLSSAARLNHELEERACAMIAAFHRRRGLHAEADQYEQRYWELRQRSEQAQRERDGVRTTDSFAEHALDAVAIESLAKELRGAGGVRRAMLVRKRLVHDAQHSLFVLGLVSDLPWWKLTRQRAESELVTRISQECRFPGETLIISLRTNKAFYPLFRKIPGSEIVVRE